MAFFPLHACPPFFCPSLLCLPGGEGGVESPPSARRDTAAAVCLAAVSWRACLARRRPSRLSRQAGEHAGSCGLRASSPRRAARPPAASSSAPPSYGVRYDENGTAAGEAPAPEAQAPCVRPRLPCTVAVPPVPLCSLCTRAPRRGCCHAAARVARPRAATTCGVLPTHPPGTLPGRERPQQAPLAQIRSATADEACSAEAAAGHGGYPAAWLSGEELTGRICVFLSQDHVIPRDLARVLPLR